jgi:S1-C subfamily serine protease
MRRRRRHREYMLLTALCAACALLGVVIGLMLRPQGQGLGQEADAPVVAAQAPSLSTADVAEKWGRSVAEVVVEYRARRRENSAESNGTGVYVDQRGYFLTNHHVIEDALSMRVRLADGQELDILDSASDPTYDLAVLYTGSVEGLGAVKIGDSESLRIGDGVIAIGYPRVGDDVLSGTLTTGVVSGLGRLNVTAGNVSPDIGMIQTDAAINAGNSGGALLDETGALIGVPTMKIASGYGNSFEGLAFAIPIDVAWPVAQRLMEQIAGRM